MSQRKCMKRYRFRRSSLRLGGGACVVLAVLMISCGEPTTGGSDSFLIEGATVVEGTGAPAYSASVRVRGGRIEALGTLSPEPGERVVRQERRLELERAVHKMTALSAAHMGMTDRGVIRAGAVADLVAFDPGVVLDRSTPAEPHLPAIGIETVWVGGTVVYRAGSGATGALPGVVIRREG